MNKIFLIGYMGTGKSYWGDKLSQSLGLPRVDLDQVIVEREGISITEIFDRFGEDHFRRLEHQYLLQLLEQDSFLLSCGGGTPCFHDNMVLMNRAGLTLWINSSVERLLKNLKPEISHRPLLKGKTDLELENFVRSKLAERTFFYNQAKCILDPDQFTEAIFIKKVKKCIEDS